MEKDLLQKLALIYVKANTEKGTTPKQIYMLYKKAETELREASSDDFNANISDPKFSF